jgi:hypothetical protein
MLGRFTADNGEETEISAGARYSNYIVQLQRIENFYSEAWRDYMLLENMDFEAVKIFLDVAVALKVSIKPLTNIKDVVALDIYINQLKSKKEEMENEYSTNALAIFFKEFKQIAERFLEDYNVMKQAAGLGIPEETLITEQHKLAVSLGIQDVDTGKLEQIDENI